MVSREQHFSNNGEHNIDDLLNWAIVVNYYRSNERYVDLEKAEQKSLFEDEFLRESILMYGKCPCSKAEVCEQFRNKYSINDNNKVIDYVSIPRNGGCPNHNYADIHTFYHHCMAKMRLKTVAGMHMLDVNYLYLDICCHLKILNTESLIYVIFAAIIYAKNTSNIHTKSSNLSFPNTEI